MTRTVLSIPRLEGMLKETFYRWLGQQRDLFCSCKRVTIFKPPHTPIHTLFVWPCIPCCLFRRLEGVYRARVIFSILFRYVRIIRKGGRRTDFTLNPFPLNKLAFIFTSQNVTRFNICSRRNENSQHINPKYRHWKKHENIPDGNKCKEDGELTVLVNKTRKSPLPPGLVYTFGQNPSSNKSKKRVMGVKTETKTLVYSFRSSRRTQIWSHLVSLPNEHSFAIKRRWRRALLSSKERVYFGD